MCHGQSRFDHDRLKEQTLPMLVTTLQKALIGYKYTLLTVFNWDIPVFAMSTSIDSGFRWAWNGLDSSVPLPSILNVLENIFDRFSVVFRLMECMSIGSICDKVCNVTYEEKQGFLYLWLRDQWRKSSCGDLDTVNANRCLVERKSFGFQMCG